MYAITIIVANKDGGVDELHPIVGSDPDTVSHVAERCFFDVCGRLISNWDEYTPEDRDAVLENGYETTGSGLRISIVHQTEEPVFAANDQDMSTKQVYVVFTETDDLGDGTYLGDILGVFTDLEKAHQLRDKADNREPVTGIDWDELRDFKTVGVAYLMLNEPTKTPTN